MKTYVKTDFGIYTEEEFVPTSHWKYSYILKEEKKNNVKLVPQSAPEETWDTIRFKRNTLLKQTDWMSNSDVEIPNKPKWLIYRQQLRDLTKTFDSPSKVRWPKQPN